MSGAARPHRRVRDVTRATEAALIEQRGSAWSVSCLLVSASRSASRANVGLRHGPAKNVSDCSCPIPTYYPDSPSFLSAKSQTCPRQKGKSTIGQSGKARSRSQRHIDVLTCRLSVVPPLGSAGLGGPLWVRASTASTRPNHLPRHDGGVHKGTILHSPRSTKSTRSTVQFMCRSSIYHGFGTSTPTRMVCIRLR